MSQCLTYKLGAIIKVFLIMIHTARKLELMSYMIMWAGVKLEVKISCLFGQRVLRQFFIFIHSNSWHIIEYCDKSNPALNKYLRIMLQIQTAFNCIGVCCAL